MSDSAQMGGFLSQGLCSFLKQYIHSVDDLDVLMLVRSVPAKDWSATDVSEQLRIDPISASNRLVALYLQGLLSHPRGSGQLYHYRYHPPRALEKLSTELAEVYATHRDAIADYVAQNQRGQMAAFARAFRLGKSK